MKQSLRDKIEQMLHDLEARQEVLNKHIGEYVKSENFGDAATAQIKYQTLETVRIRLCEALAY